MFVFISTLKKIAAKFVARCCVVTCSYAMIYSMSKIVCLIIIVVPGYVVLPFKELFEN